jgi:prepilin-type N-terminal cleavage/methylation domain-containing protein
MRNRRGFTLIELTVTLVILGILATLSANAYIAVVEKGRWAEAREVLLKCYAGYARSVDDNNLPVMADIASGAFWTKLGMSNPNAMANSRFTYTVVGPIFQVTAERLPPGSGNRWLMFLSNGMVSRNGNAPIF